MPSMSNNPTRKPTAVPTPDNAETARNFGPTHTYRVGLAGVGAGVILGRRTREVTAGAASEVLAGYQSNPAVNRMWRRA